MRMQVHSIILRKSFSIASCDANRLPHEGLILPIRLTSCICSLLPVYAGYCLICQVLTNARQLNPSISPGRGGKQVGDCAMHKMDLTQRGVLQTTNLLAAGTMSLGEAALAGLAESPFSIRSTQVKRVRFRSRRSFDEVLQRLHQLVPAAITPEQYRAAMMKAGGVSLESFEKVVRSQTEQSGFMLFAEFDYHQWLGLYGIQRKLARWILGNPVIAITMIRHDLEAALFAPVELLLVEDENREGVTVIYDLPSSLMVTRKNPPLLEAAAALDAKLQDLVTEVTSGS